IIFGEPSELLRSKRASCLAMSANLLRFSSNSLVRAFRHCCSAVSDDSGAPSSCASSTSICLKSLKVSWLMFILLRVITSHLERLRVRPIVEQVFLMNSTSAATVSALPSGRQGIQKLKSPSEEGLVVAGGRTAMAPVDLLAEDPPGIGSCNCQT